MEAAEVDVTEIVLRDRYRLKEVIGNGGMATVYRATDELLGRDVAVKVFRTTAVDQADIELQETEIKLLASFNHPGLVTVIDAGTHIPDLAGPQLFLVMELVDGDDLMVRLSNGALPSRQVAQIGFDVAEALEYIHDRGVIHRDVKPANILTAELNSDATRVRAKLTDFGIATFANDIDLTAENVITGTAAYLSPEQVLAEGAIPASDVYSLGLVLLQCLTGELAFPGDAVSSAVARVSRDPEIPSYLADDWRSLLTAMTSRDPIDRPILRDLILMLRDILFSEVGRHRADDADVAVSNEADRMAAVLRYEILDTPADGAFDRITAMAARTFSVPIAIVSIVDHDRIWFKSHHGVDVEQISRDPGLCASAIMGNETWIVEDARHDPRTLANPLVASDFGLQFYAGVPLRTQDGYNLGTLCVLDFEPRTITPGEISTLQDLAALVTSELDLRLAARMAARDLRPAPALTEMVESELRDLNSSALMEDISE